MPGVVRPMNLQDVIQTLNNQSQGTGTQAQTINGVGFYAEADETVTMSDTATTQVSLPLGWDQEVWGGISWG